MSSDEQAQTNGSIDSANEGSFLSDILKPGSSMHPTFLLILDIAFFALFLILIGLLFLTNGNPHIFALILIEMGLWASVKWVVYELKHGEGAIQQQHGTNTQDTVPRESKKDS